MDTWTMRIWDVDTWSVWDVDTSTIREYADVDMWARIRACQETRIHGWYVEVDTAITMSPELLIEKTHHNHDQLPTSKAQETI